MDFSLLSVWQRLRFAWAVVRGCALEISGHGERTLGPMMPSTAANDLN
jgi:hypothetical protein